jgi:excisionase family DNA binding protein
MYYYDDTELNVPDVADVLNCNQTYVYRAIRNERIKALDTTPTKVRFDEVKKYIESQLPPSFKVFFKQEQMA